MEAFFVYLLIGAIAGTLGGMLGVGGGIIVVPALVWLFHAQGVAQSHIMHLAVGTSLASIVATSLASVRAHHQHGAVHWSVLRTLGPGFALGALLGAIAAAQLAGGPLKLAFGVFLCLIAAQLVLPAKGTARRSLPSRISLVAVGTAIGGLSAMLGIGGGNLTVPFLLHYGVPMRQAVATGAAAGVPIATVGAVAYMIAGQGARGLPTGSVGYVYGPALVGIAAMSVLCAPLGAKLAHRLPTMVLRRVFGLFLLAVGLRMLMGAVDQQ